MINTVLGTVNKKELGLMLSHEHLCCGGFDVESLYFEKKYDEEKTEEVYKRLLPVFRDLFEAGCRSIVEASPPDEGQNLKLMQKLSKESGIKILPNTGMYFSIHTYDIHKKADEMELAKRWIKDYEKGFDTIEGITIRPSQIKIFTNRGKLMECYKKVIKAAVIASKATGMPIHCHIIEAGTAEDVMDLLEEIDCNYEKFLWAHAGDEGNKDTIKRALELGMWLGFDEICREDFYKYYELINDAFKNGYKDRILLSQDFDFYEEVIGEPLKHPCADLFTKFIPYCVKMGLDGQELRGILRKNPAEFFDIID